MNSDIVLKLIQRLIGRKEFESIPEAEQGISQSASKLAFYEHVVRLLKQLGCLLNHIRPEFLLQK